MSYLRYNSVIKVEIYYQNFDELVISPLNLRLRIKTLSKFDFKKLLNEKKYYFKNISSFHKIYYALKKSFNIKCEIIINESYVDCDSVTYL